MAETEQNASEVEDLKRTIQDLNLTRDELNKRISELSRLTNRLFIAQLILIERLGEPRAGGRAQHEG